MWLGSIGDVVTTVVVLVRLWCCSVSLMLNIPMGILELKELLHPMWLLLLLFWDLCVGSDSAESRSKVYPSVWTLVIAV